MVSQESKTSSPGSHRADPSDGDGVRETRGRGRGQRDRQHDGKKGRRRQPLDEAALRDLALAYVARFSTTGAKLEAYLARKLRERGIAEDADGRSAELDIPALVGRMVELGYVDDAVYARSKARDLTQRGYGARRVEQALWAAGVEENLRCESAPGEAESRRAAIQLARKRRFGPFGAHRTQGLSRDESHKLREKQVAAMLRAGHSIDHAVFIMDAATIDDIDTWLEEAEADERDESGSW